MRRGYQSATGKSHYRPKVHTCTIIECFCRALGGGQYVPFCMSAATVFVSSRTRQKASLSTKRSRRSPSAPRTGTTSAASATFAATAPLDAGCATVSSRSARQVNGCRTLWAALSPSASNGSRSATRNAV